MPMQGWGPPCYMPLPCPLGLPPSLPKMAGNQRESALQVAGFVMDSCSDNAPSSELSAVFQEFKEVVLQYCMAFALFFPA